jgi:hypothetical protein
MYVIMAMAIICMYVNGNNVLCHAMAMAIIMYVCM